MNDFFLNMQFSRVVATRVLTVLMIFSFTGIELNAQCNSAAIFANDSTPEYCDEVVGNVRNIYATNLPAHPYGPWPSMNVPGAKDFAFSVCAYPIKGDTSTSIYGYGAGTPGCNDIYRIGITTHSTVVAAWANMYFQNPNTGQNNLDWNVEAVNLNLDAYGAHVASDEYHYHLPPGKYYLDSLGINGTFHSPLLGYAADGYPLYYRYGYSDPMDPNSSIIDLLSCYQLKSGNRPGDNITAPGGTYDGTYTEDYEHVPSANCHLDECNGRFGVTPEFPSGTYYYIMTDDFPYFPRCLYGTVLDNTFRIGAMCPASTTSTDCSSSTTSVYGYLSEDLGISVYPNPSVGVLNIGVVDQGRFLSKVTRISIYNQAGQVVWESKAGVMSIDLGQQPNGIYFVEINAGSQQFVEKVLIQK